MEKQMIIYGLKDPNTQKIRYIGQTVRPIQYRLGQHLREKNNWHKYNWLQKLKKDGQMPLVEILDTAQSVRELNLKEFWHIALTEGLLNLTPGGNAPPNNGPKKRKPVFRSDGMEYSSYSEAALANGLGSHSNISQAIRKKRMANGYFWSKAPFGEISDKRTLRSKKIYCSNGKEYLSMIEASRSAKVSYKSLHLCLKNKTKSCGRLFWSYDKKTIKIIKKTELDNFKIRSLLKVCAGQGDV